MMFCRQNGYNVSVEMASDDALTNAGNHVTSNIACARSQQYTKDLII